MAIRVPSITVAQQRDELARKLAELVTEFNALEVRLEDADEALDTRVDAAETNITTLQSTRVEGRGNGAANRLAYWSSANAITSNANGTFDGTNLTITDRLVTSDPTVTLQTGLQARVNVGGVKTTPRIMMGPTANVGALLIFETIQGKNGAGAITAANLAVGDIVKHVLGVLPLGIVGDAKASFESTITVNGQIQQSSGSNLSTINYLVVVERRSSTGATNERPLYMVP